MKHWIIGLLLLSIIAGSSISVSSVFASYATVNTVSAKNNSLLISSSEGDNVSASALTCIISNSGDYIFDLRIRNPGTKNITVTIYPPGKKLDVLANQTKRYDLHLANEVKLLNLSVDNETLLQVQSPPCTTAGYSGSGASSSGYSQSSPPPGEVMPSPTSPSPTSPSPTSPLPTSPSPTSPSPTSPSPTSPLPTPPSPTSPSPTSPLPTPPSPTPPLPPPIPELSTLVLTLAGISGLMLLSQTRRD